MKNYYLSLILVCLTCTGFAQSLWSDTTEPRNPLDRKNRISHPKQYHAVTLDVNQFLNDLREVPMRTSLDAENNTFIFEFPMPDGSTSSFRLVDAELMHPDLAAKFPELKSYIGKGIDDPTADLRITYSPYHGFNGMIRSGNHSTVYIDPLTKDLTKYMVYYRKDVDRPDQGFTCHTQGADLHGERRTQESSELQLRQGDCNLRRYRLAQSCNGQYSLYHIGQAGGSTGNDANDKAIVQAAMNVTMARVNGVYEIDLGITMQFVADNDDVIYLDPATDPWTNEFNTTTAQTLDAVIGVNNYDIGHNFNTSGGGNAGCLTCVCTSLSQSGTHKGRGYTGRSAPIGDPFDIDYVAHEMGHQFGGYHTQSNQSCRSGSGQTEVEPGSGSTIMGYAGICSANVQSNSDDYFHYVNVNDIVDAINNGVENTCAELIVSGNSSPTADAGLDYTIPVSTAFVLTGTGTDPNDAGLTYCWDQNDPENHGNNLAPSATRTVGPMFRSFNPVTVDYRYFPSLNAIINNTTPQFEVLPSVSRTMDFSFIVRDNNLNSGCTESDLMTVTTDAAAGPFLVTVPNTAVTWDVGNSETITWDVAGTDIAPVNCANVDIMLSTDGGLTYSVTLASNVPNTGSASIGVPNEIGANNRVMIKCSDNIFFDISNEDFMIQALSPTVEFSAPGSGVYDEGTSCSDRDVTVSLTMSVQPSATTTVNLSTSGSATIGTDYSLSATSVVFTTTDWDTPKSVTLSVNEDAVVEIDETISIEIASVTGSDASAAAANQVISYNLRNDDINPNNTGTPTTITLLVEDFEGGFPAAWTRTGSAQTFESGDATALSSGSWTIPGSNTTQMVASNDDDCNCDMSNDVMTSSSVTVNSNYNSLSVAMDVYFIAGTYQSNTEEAYFEVSKDGGSTFPISNALVGDAASWQNLSFDLSSELPASGTENWVFRWRYYDGTGWLYGLAVDNVLVTAGEPAVIDVQENTNTVSGFAEHNIGPGDIVHFYDQSTGNIMCTIDNSASSHDYGCTKVEVDRAGTNAVVFVVNDPASYVASKSLKITPTNNTSSDAGYTITMYYSDAELTGWETATGKTRNEVYFHKVDGDNRVSDVTVDNTGALSITTTAATYAAYGTSNHAFTATYTNGFSGFGMGSDVSVPVELVDFKGENIENEGNLLEWETATEENTSHFELEHSYDGNEFISLATIDAAGFSTALQQYNHLHEQPRSGTHYYRLKIVDLDETYEYSNIVIINIVSTGTVFMSPNPTKGSLNLNMSNMDKENIQVEVFDISGKLVISETILVDGEMNHPLDLGRFANGTYLVKLTGSSFSMTEKVVKY